MPRLPDVMPKSSRLTAAPQPVSSTIVSETEAGEVVGQFAQALFDVIGERQPILRVQPAALLFAERFGRRLIELRRPDLLAAFGGSL